MMHYRSFDPAPYGFPKPEVPVLPPLGVRSLSLRQEAPIRALMDAPNARFYTRGRYALTDAFRLCGLAPGFTLLAPAYHCRTMLDPALRLGAEIALYPLRADLSPDMAGLADCLAHCAQPVRALLVTHYFGFPQAISPLLEWCLVHDIALVEDCSHCLFLPPVSGDLGLRGRYCVSSPYKFFPTEDGGLLWANAGAPLPQEPAYSPGASQELKAVARAFQTATVSRTASDAGVTARALAGMQTVPEALSEDRNEQEARPSPLYHLAAERSTNLATSRWLMRHTRLRRLMNRRRENYQTWVQSVVQLPHCRVLLPDLPADCVPYMLPLLIDHPELHFFALKQLGLPIWRWDDMATSGCAVATRYRLHLLHLPCHQELSPAQLRWMTTVLSSVMCRDAARGQA